MIFVGNVCVSGRGQMSNLRTRAIEKKGKKNLQKKKNTQVKHGSIRVAVRATRRVSIGRAAVELNESLRSCQPAAAAAAARFFVVVRRRDVAGGRVEEADDDQEEWPRRRSCCAGMFGGGGRVSSLGSRLMIVAVHAR